MVVLTQLPQLAQRLILHLQVMLMVLEQFLPQGHLVDLTETFGIDIDYS
jgi:hypothetical protein